MKKFFISVFVILSIILGLDYGIYYKGIYMKGGEEKPLTIQVRTNGQMIEYQNQEGNYEALTIKGVELTSSIPGHYITDYAIDETTYLRWFRWIQEMGANTISVPNIMDDTFYHALYNYNTQNESPLYVLQGISITDYANNNKEDAYSEGFYQALKEAGMGAVDVIHGKKKILINKGIGTGHYNKDVSEWVLGYILATDWNADTVAYTNHNGYDAIYDGEYIQTTSDATAFEAMLAKIMDQMIDYESEKYHVQRLISFMNSPVIDPFEYDKHYAKQLGKHTQLDAENLKVKKAFKSGYFASYRVYDFCENFYDYFSEEQKGRLLDTQQVEELQGETYGGYVRLLNAYHTIPVIVGYGFSSSRGTVKSDPLSEFEQGKALVKGYEGFIKAGSAGVVISAWQDIWGQSTWNTSYALTLNNRHYWNDIQSYNQGNGLLSFDPGEIQSICYIDGKDSEWTEEDVIIEHDGIQLSAKYDERGIYLLIQGEQVNSKQPLYIPIDTTKQTGSSDCEQYLLQFEKNADFLLVLDGPDNSQVLVQKRYESIRANYSIETTGVDAYVEVPEADTPLFVPIHMMSNDKDLIGPDETIKEIQSKRLTDVLETGKLHYGNGNPESETFNSLADFYYGEDLIEIRIPWQLLNFSDPSHMQIHADYYRNYGVEHTSIDELYIGIAKANRNKHEPIPMEALSLKGWGQDVAYHERLKQSYYIVQQAWGGSK